jgi:hypothetical protein
VAFTRDVAVPTISGKLDVGWKCERPERTVPEGADPFP